MSNFSCSIIYLHHDQIKLDRIFRQRSEIDTTDIIDSIRENGIINPIIVSLHPSPPPTVPSKLLYILIAGERRLMACKELNIKVPCRLYSSLDPILAEVIELEENLKRKDLNWRDEAKAIARLHKVYIDQSSIHTIDHTAKSLSLSKSHITNCLTIAKYQDLKLLDNATNINQAISLLHRFHLHQEQTIAAVIANNPLPDYLIEDEKIKPTKIDVENLIVSFDNTPPHTPGPRAQPARGISLQNEISSSNNSIIIDNSQPTPENFIINQEFRSYIEEHEMGAESKFNFVYLDIGFKIDYYMFDMHKLTTPDTDIMIWFKFEHYIEIDTMMNDFGFDLITPPLIWFKTDIKEYETALIFSRKPDKKLNLKPYIFPAPTSQISTDKKPESMLRFFFQKIMTKSTNFFDPLCGNGASLRAADSIGVNSIFGLEPNPDLCTKGNELIQRDRLLRKRF